MHRASCGFWLKGRVGNAFSSSLSRTLSSHSTTKLHFIAPFNTSLSIHHISHMSSQRFCSTVSCGLRNKISLLANGKVSIASTDLSFNPRFLFPALAMRQDVFRQSSRLLSKASSAGTSTVTAVQSDLSLLTGKRLTRRPRVKEITNRDQVMNFCVHFFLLETWVLGPSLHLHCWTYMWKLRKHITFTIILFFFQSFFSLCILFSNTTHSVS